MHLENRIQNANGRGAALVVCGQVRFTRERADAGFPGLRLSYRRALCIRCLHRRWSEPDQSGAEIHVLLLGHDWPSGAAPDVPRLPSALGASGLFACLLAAFRWAPPLPKMS